MTVTVTEIRAMASRSPVEVLLSDGSTFMIQAPEHVGGWPSGHQIMLPLGEESMVVVEAGDVASVHVGVPDPEIESLRRGEIPSWLMDRMRERPELFIQVARMEPEYLARMLGRTEG